MNWSSVYKSWENIVYWHFRRLHLRHKSEKFSVSNSLSPSLLSASLSPSLSHSHSLSHSLFTIILISDVSFDTSTSFSVYLHKHTRNGLKWFFVPLQESTCFYVIKGSTHCAFRLNRSTVIFVYKTNKIKLFEDFTAFKGILILNETRTLCHEKKVFAQGVRRSTRQKRRTFFEMKNKANGAGIHILQAFVISALDYFLTLFL